MFITYIAKPKIVSFLYCKSRAKRPMSTPWNQNKLFEYDTVNKNQIMNESKLGYMGMVASSYLCQDSVTTVLGQSLSSGYTTWPNTYKHFADLQDIYI